MRHTHKLPRWGYLAMLVKLHRLVASVLTWAESCRCHGWLRRLTTDDRSTLYSEHAQRLIDCLRRLGTAGGDGPHFKCPLAGKRAVELAVGALKDVLNELCESTLGEIMVAIGFECTSEERATIINDFTLAKTLFVSTVLAKLNFWETLPWMLAGVGHWIPSKATCL